MFVGSDSMKATVLQAGLKCFVTVCKKCLASLEMWLDVESRSVVRVRVFNFNGATAGDIEVYSAYNMLGINFRMYKSLFIILSILNHYQENIGTIFVSRTTNNLMFTRCRSSAQ